MADANVLRLQDDLICSICLETLTDPVSIPCGHNFCMKCISESWNHSSVCRCPQCRETFTPRPSLSRNTLLNEVIEKIKQMGPLLSQSYARPEDVECDACTGKKFRAVQSCLTCLASYCKIHLQPHCEGAAFKDHKLIAPDRNLQQKRCSKHHKCLEIFCKKDQMCICLLCVVTDHNTHEMVEVEKEREEKQKQLRSTILEIQTKLQERNKKLEEIKQAVEKTEIYADKELEESEKTFTELILRAEEILKNVKELITVQKNREVEKAARVREHLEKEIEELKRKNAELAELSETDDNIHFLQTFPSTSVLPGDEESLRFTVITDVSFGNLRKGLSCLKEHLEGISKMEIEKISRSGSEVLAPILQPSTPQSRDEFLQYSCPLTLDPSTAHRELHLSEGDRKARRGPVTRYRDHPDRFDCWPLVLCREALEDRHFYWEVEWTGDWIDIGVTYKGICRKGTSLDCGLGYNDKSWSLFCSDSRYSVRHNKIETVIPAHHSPRIGVYLDHPSGCLSFYSVSGTMTLLHTFKASFTEPLYPGFWVTDSLTICQTISEQHLPRVTS